MNANYSQYSNSYDDDITIPKIIIAIILTILFIAILVCSLHCIFNDAFAITVASWISLPFTWIDFDVAEEAKLAFYYSKIFAFAFLTFIPMILMYLSRFISKINSDFLSILSLIIFVIAIAAAIGLDVLFYIQTRIYFIQIDKSNLTEGFLHGLSNFLTDFYKIYILYAFPIIGQLILLFALFWDEKSFTTTDNIIFLLTSIFVTFGLIVALLWITYILAISIWIAVAAVIVIFILGFLRIIFKETFREENAVLEDGTKVSRFGSYGAWYDSYGNRYEETGSGYVQRDDDDY